MHLADTNQNKPHDLIIARIRQEKLNYNKTITEGKNRTIVYHIFIKSDVETIFQFHQMLLFLLRSCERGVFYVFVCRICLLWDF